MKTLRYTYYALVAVALAGVATAQTRIDLRTQTKAVDFSQADSTRPSKTGTSLPATCATGETFLKLDAPAGRNWYVCTAANHWSQQGADALVAGGDVSGGLASTTVVGIQGRSVSSAPPSDGQVLAWNAALTQWKPTAGTGGTSGAGMAAQLGDFAVTKTAAATLTIGQGCSTATPCNVRFGSRAYSLTSGASAALTGGAGTAYIYLTTDGILTAGHTMSVACSGSCVAVSGVTGFPVDSIPLYSWDAAGGVWGDTGADRRSWISRSTLLAGFGIVMVEAGGQTTVSVDDTVVPTYLKNSASLDFPLIAAGTCSSDLTFTIAGASAGDTVAPGWPSGLASGLVGNMRVSAPNQIAVRLCAMGQDIDPASAVFSATIIRGL